MNAPPGFTTRDLRVAQPLTAGGTPAHLGRELAGVLTPEVLAPLPPSLALPTGPRPNADWISARVLQSSVQPVRVQPGGALIGLLLTHCGNGGSGGASVHLGYLLARDSWGKGYATQLVQGLVQAMAGHGSGTLVGGVDPGNRASIRVLEKAGFTLDAGQSTLDTWIYTRQIPAATGQ